MNLQPENNYIYDCPLCNTKWPIIDLIWGRYRLSTVSICTIIVHIPMLSSPRVSRAFHKLRRYHTRPLRLNWGPENVHFEKRIFVIQILMKGFFFVENLKNYQAQLFYVLSFPLRYLKTAQKMVQKF